MITRSRRLYLVACVGRKHRTPRRARDLYASDWFRKARAYVEACQPDAWFILSARHGLVAPDSMLGPYEQTLATMSASAWRDWAGGVVTALRKVCRAGDHVVVLAGDHYREGLLPALREWGCRVDVPMQGLGIGKQLGCLKRHGPPVGH